MVMASAARGAFVEERGIGKGQPGQIGDHGLEIEQTFETALRDLGLVGGILGIPARILENIAKDYTGYNGVIIALTDIGLEYFILSGDFAKGGQVLVFA